MKANSDFIVQLSESTKCSKIFASYRLIANATEWFVFITDEDRLSKT